MTVGIGDLSESDKAVDGALARFILEAIGIKVVQVKQVGWRGEIQASVNCSERVVEGRRRSPPSGPLLFVLDTVEIAKHHGGRTGVSNAVAGKVVPAAKENSVVE